MESKRVFVFRVNYDDAHQYIMDELKNGILRQGWGSPGLSLIDHTGKKVGKQIWMTNFNKIGDKNDEEASKRFSILSRILEIKIGDILVIPKTRNWQTLSICTVIKDYWFDDISLTMWDDFKHCLKIDNLRSYSYDSCSEAKLISSKFIAYQSAINNVWSNTFVENVLTLYKQEDNFKSETIRQLLLQIKAHALNKIAPELLNINPNSFEDIIGECLKAKGYVIAAMRKYDGAGSDADIIANFPLPILNSFIECSPTLLIQVKKKSGFDNDDIAGINQLIKSRKNYSNPICILMHSSEHISEETEKYANKENIKIINGSQLLEFILTTDFN